MKKMTEIALFSRLSKKWVERLAGCRAFFKVINKNDFGVKLVVFHVWVESEWRR
jgi:hypothetical protein